MKENKRNEIGEYIGAVTVLVSFGFYIRLGMRYADWLIDQWKKIFLDIKEFFKKDDYDFTEEKEES